MPTIVHEYRGRQSISTCNEAINRENFMLTRKALKTVNNCCWRTPEFNYCYQSKNFSVQRTIRYKMTRLIIYYVCRWGIITTYYIIMLYIYIYTLYFAILLTWYILIKISLKFFSEDAIDNKWELFYVIDCCQILLRYFVSSLYFVFTYGGGRTLGYFVIHKISVFMEEPYHHCS